MDRLKREASLLSSKAWAEIDEAAIDVIKNTITTRRLFHLEGPKGWDYAAVNEGRLGPVDDNKKTKVRAAQYKIFPLTEARIEFNLNKWEMDNIERGAKDIDLGPLEDAVKELVLFEENAVYNGYAKGNISGMDKTAKHVMKMPAEANQILKAVAEAKYQMLESYVEGPYTLVVSQEVYDRLNVIHEGMSLYKLVEKIIGGRIIRSKAVKGAFLIREDLEDLALTVGQDYAIGYVRDEGEEVKLFATLSFTFRILDEEAYVKFTL